MKDNIINNTINATMTLNGLCIMISVIATWFVLWHLLIKKLLSRCKVNSFWYALYELGAAKILCILIFLSLITILFIGSIQAVLYIGIKMAFPLFIFWGGFIAFIVFLIRGIRGKK